MLKVRDLQVKYGVIEAVRGINFDVKNGEIVTIIGANGAGKSSTLNSIMNLVPKKGKVEFFEEDITNLPTNRIVERGLGLVPEGRRIFINLTVEENLKLGAYTNPDEMESLMEFVYSIFPRLKEKREQFGGSLSGGEQQMLAVGRALMAGPKMLLLDEPSMGLAPIVVKELFGVLKQLNREEGITILLVEQNAGVALRLADRGYVLENGKIVMEDKSDKLLSSPEVRKKYLGG
ncbi:MAG: ABC transporter ATP-binding protein [Epsilonproteobacteria bacterium]|jgi:branched-chain amino acid transport system ATP-binding protein|nr:ABC transporter ATP-binding protein [Campylobacterota bacterium]NPA88824.1 ABC transporter ATP-binding protein [Campylobacterota bacterium]